jgi:hypothetical protein
MDMVYGEGTNDFELVGIGEKIGVFFWASDAGRQTDIDKYIGYLEEDEDYDTFYEFEDSSNVASDCGTVDAYEIDADTIFVYIIGHGSNVGGHSYTNFANGSSNTGSHTFRGYMDNWEANRKAILVESCEAGDWADDFAASPYLAMATSDESHSAYTYMGEDTPYEGKFSHYFFAQQHLGAVATAAFSHAYDLTTSPAQYAKISDYSTYVWFDD